ncbi:hypothetical protein BJ980_003124 [Nocardioides daedukensis]|uniref:Uncharacterized protein n=1 Tax=Nocardioides daedukensis TaxID=634462 RepID=A0A7Y9S0T5_9ACTN|nr:DUF6350 family protein [Nocardioides daedukensis]NYG60201.1 hypothetical protein [Nocardioides daedukensis]
MTATLSAPRAPGSPTRPRPLALLATGAGACAAGVTLVACLVIAVIGWFLADGGVHGAPREALRTGGMAWLMAHGSGVTIRGAAVTAVPLGLTALCALSTWKFGLRLGEQVAGHGPDADALSDGERDWTVPVATSLFAAVYVVIGVLVSVLSGTQETLPSTGAVVLWSLALAALIGGGGIAIGSGRAAIWLSLAPASVRATALTAWSVMRWFLGVSLLFFVGSLLLDLGAAMSVMSQLHLDLGDGVIFCLVMLVLVPNAMVFSASFLLGPGFTVGTGTLVSPATVAIGPVPMFPMLAALPENGPTPGWMPALLVVPVLTAAVAVFAFQRQDPVLGWDEGALRGVVGGVLAGLGLGVLAALAGGAVGPGRMAEVGPLAGEVVFHAMVSLGIGGLIGGLVATWWHRRTAGDPTD